MRQLQARKETSTFKLGCEPAPHFYHIGGRHTDIENLKKGLPGHVRGDVKEAAKELLKDEILMPKITSYGLHVSLNPRKRAEIDKHLK